MEIFNFEQWTPQWYSIRRGVVTGTRLKSAIGSPAVRRTLIIELLGEALCDVDENATSGSSYQMEHGNMAESVIKQDFVTETVTEVGFIKKYEWLGLSPDGLIERDGKFRKGLEIKSPASKNFVKWALEGGIPEEHEPQVLMYFIVIDDLEELEFVIVNEHVKIMENRIRRIVVTREQLNDKIEKAKEALSVFKTEWDAMKKQLISSLS